MEEEKKEIVEEAKEVATEEQKLDPHLEEAEPGEELKDHYVFPLKGFLIFMGILLTLIIACVVVILCNGGFNQW